MNSRAFVTLFSLALLFMTFQNCSFHYQSSAVNAKSEASSASGGQPYDGKPYIVKSQCADGTLVDSRLVRFGSTTKLYRQNCQSITPQVLDSAKVQQISANQVLYGDQVFELEQSAIPLPGIVTWFMQLTGILQSNNSSIYLVDMFGYDSQTIASLKQSGHTVICVISAGTIESWNPDANQFAAADIGNAIQGSAGENWIDTRSSNVRSIMLARMELAKSKGCQGLDFDAVDGFENKTGFPLTVDTQLDYNEFLAFAAHDRGLIMTINGVASLATQMSQIFDLAVAEQCFSYGECQGYQSFVSLGKPVLAVEYGTVKPSYCSQAKDMSISLEFFNQKLDGTGFGLCQ